MEDRVNVIKSKLIKICRLWPDAVDCDFTNTSEEHLLAFIADQVRSERRGRFNRFRCQRAREISAEIQSMTPAAIVAALSSNNRSTIAQQ